MMREGLPTGVKLLSKRCQGWDDATPGRELLKPMYQISFQQPALSLQFAGAAEHGPEGRGACQLRPHSLWRYLSARDALQRNIPMLLGWVDVTLGLEHTQGSD
jgi:hypothetical protein